MSHSISDTTHVNTRPRRAARPARTSLRRSAAATRPVKTASSCSRRVSGRWPSIRGRSGPSGRGGASVAGTRPGSAPFGDSRSRGRHQPSGPSAHPGGGGLIDVDGDGERADESLSALIGGEIPNTIAWSATAAGTCCSPRISTGSSGSHRRRGRGGQGRGRQGVLAPPRAFRPRDPGRRPQGRWLGNRSRASSPRPRGPTASLGSGPTRQGGGRWLRSPKPPTRSSGGWPRHARNRNRSRNRCRGGRPKPAARGGARKARTDGRNAYTVAALRKECDAVEAATEGNRNNRLNAAAFSLGQLVERTRPSIGSRWSGPCWSRRPVGPGSGQGEAVATIRSGIDAGMLQPRDLNGVGHAGPPPSKNGDGHREPEPADDRPAIEVTTEHHDVLEEALRALAHNRDLYRRGDSLGIVVEEGKPAAKLTAGINSATPRGATASSPCPTPTSVATSPGTPGFSGGRPTAAGSRSPSIATRPTG